MTCDGEHGPLTHMMSDEGLAQLEALMIDLGKVPAATTALLQTSDVCPLFKLLHNLLNSDFTREYSTAGEPVLRANLTAVLVANEQKLEWIDRIPKEKMERIVQALVQAIIALKKAATTKMLVDAYKKVVRRK
jgi:hypothetical protein